MRERVPSTTLTCTLTVSPGRKSGMSVAQRWRRRARSRVCMASPRRCHRSPTAVSRCAFGVVRFRRAGSLERTPCGRGARGRRSGRRVCHERSEARRSAARHRAAPRRPRPRARPGRRAPRAPGVSRPVRASQPGRARSGRAGRAVRRERLLAAPRARSRRGRPEQQHLGHVAARASSAAWCRPGLRAGPPSRRGANESSPALCSLPSTPGQQPCDRLDDRQHRGLAAGQHVVADADLVDVASGAGSRSTTRASMPS